MSHSPALPEVDLFEGLDAVIANTLGVASHRTRTAALSLCRPELQFNGVQLITALFEKLEANWSDAIARSPRGSEQNFRWHVPQAFISPHNKSPEVSLERAFVAALNAADRSDWSNQVPVVSGITGSRSGKRRAVDLVRQTTEGFEFIELKIGSDTPLFAGLEVLEYGMLWLLSRRDRHRLNYAGRPIIEASSLGLSVLAPRAFYTRYALQPLANSFDRGIQILSARFGVDMRFEFSAFSQDFIWSSPYTGEQLIAHFDRRECV